MFVLYRPPPQPVLCQSWWRWWVNIMLSGVMPVSRAGPSYLSSHCSRQPPAELQYFPANLPHNKRPFYPQQTYNHKKWKLIKTNLSQSHHYRNSSQIKNTLMTRKSLQYLIFPCGDWYLWLGCTMFQDVELLAIAGRVWAITDWVDWRHNKSV